MPRDRKPVGYYNSLLGKNEKTKQRQDKEKNDRPTVEFPCIVCGKEVHEDDRAVDCDICYQWQHIFCGNSGISAKQYDRAVKGELYFNSFFRYLISFQNNIIA